MVFSILILALTTITQEYVSSEDVDDDDMQDCNADELQWGDDIGAPSNLAEIEDTSSESDESFTFDEVSS